MATTFIQLREKTRSRLASVTDDLLVTDEELGTAVNNALQDLANERDWPWLENVTTIPTTEGTNTYDMPTDAARIHMLWYDGHPVLEAALYQDILRYFHTTNYEERPRRFAIVGDQLILSPIPRESDSLNVYYQRYEKTLSADGDVPYCPDNAVNTLITLAALDQAVRLRDQALTASLYQMLASQMERLYKVQYRSSIGPRIETRRDMDL